MSVNDRLSAGLRARGVAPGRNPDGINDDVEKALMLIDDLLAENQRLRERVTSRDPSEYIGLLRGYEPAGWGRAEGWVLAERGIQPTTESE